MRIGGKEHALAYAGNGFDAEAQGLGKAAGAAAVHRRYGSRRAQDCRRDKPIDFIDPLFVKETPQDPGAALDENADDFVFRRPLQERFQWHTIWGWKSPDLDALFAESFGLAAIGPLGRSDNQIAARYHSTVQRNTEPRVQHDSERVAC